MSLDATVIAQQTTRAFGMSERYLEDFTTGEIFRTSGVTLTETMIIDFALQYDPQSFHLVLGFRMILETGIFRAANLGSPGLDELRWLKPVKPGDTLHVEFEPVEITPSRSKPDRGSMRVAYRYVNQRGEIVLTFTAIHLMRRRPVVTIAT
jgi:acyl dehydratase